MSNLKIGDENFIKSVIEFINVASHQESKGMEKYGQGLDPLDDYDWLSMAVEEQVDGYKYLHAEMIKRAHIVNEIRKVIENDVHPSVGDKVNDLLNKLEGQK